MHRLWLRWGPACLLLGGCFDPDNPGSNGTETDTATDTNPSPTASTTMTTTTAPPTSSSGTATSMTTTSESETETGTTSTGTPPPDPAQAQDDEYFWVQGPATLEVDADEGLLANDTPGTGLLVMTAEPTSARGGDVSSEPGGGFTYEAPTGFWGVDSFGYTAQDDQGNTSDGVATIYVRPVRAMIGDLPTFEAGFSFLGKTPADLPINVSGWLGGDVRNLGDWDGDGVDDLGVVANQTPLYNEGSSGSDNQGPVYVVFGGPYSGDPDPGDLENNQGGFAIQGPATSNGDPATVAGADVNGDGMGDVVITSPFLNLTGAAYVLYGDQSTTALNLQTWDFDADGFSIEPFGGSGAPFRNLGDLNGDDRDELGYSGCNVILGADDVDGWAGQDLPGGVGFSVRGFTRCFVEPLADVDGDGLPELLMFAYDDLADAAAYVMWSDPAPTDRTFAELIANDEGYRIFDSGIGGFFDNWIWASGGGDVDGDGLGDVLVNATNVLAVVFGKGTAGEIDVVDVYGGVGGFRINTAGVSGGAARIVGDLNGDELADVLIVDQAASRAYVLYGSAAAQRDLPEDDGDGVGGFVIDGLALGASVRTASGDWNGDGLADVAIGAKDSLANDRGAVYVVYGVRTVPTP